LSKIGKIIKEHSKIIKDFLYSFIAYALPTIVLQFVIQPMIASKISADDNGLFIALFNVLKLLIGVLIMPLANMRLLKKKKVENNLQLNSFFNYLFIIVVSLSIIVGTILNCSYRHFAISFRDIISFAIILILMSIHDYFMIAYRIVLDYKKIVIVNIAVVIGYGIGMWGFIITKHWELIFIVGYLFGSIYIMSTSSLWKSKPIRQVDDRESVIKGYRELSASAFLTNASTYCDRLIIYPILGGYDVSVYNAAAIVSKAISVLSAPLRNVLLSYIVNRDSLIIKGGKIKNIIFVYVGAFAVVFGMFYAFSIVACNFLYPKYAIDAKPYIPIIIAAIMLETTGAILNIALLRFANTKIQTLNSALKMATYLLFIVLFSVVMKMGLLGFCLAILFADFMFCIAVILGLRNNISFDN